MICISLLPAIPVKADMEERLWDNEFEGTGSDKITYRSYLEFEVYDDSTDEHLGTLKIDKKAGGSSIDGEYVVKYDGKDLITFRNDGNYCFLAKGDAEYFKLDFFQFLFNNSNSSIRGHEKRNFSHLIQNLQIISVFSY